MAASSPPLIQTLTPERWLGLSMDFIEAGYAGLFVKNGKVVRKCQPGRHFSFALPVLEKCQLILVDTKIRNLDIISQGDFLSRDQYLINISLTVFYQVVDPKRVAIELSDPIAALTSAIKDSLAIAVGQMRMEQLLDRGRIFLRQYLLDSTELSYNLGFALEDIRIGDISFPQTRGVIRQVEGMSVRQEAEYEAALQIQIAEASRPVIPPPPIQQVNIISGENPQTNPPPISHIIEGNKLVTPGQLPPQTKLPQPILAPTIIADNANPSLARLVHRSSGAIFVLSTTPCTIGREPCNTLVLDDGLSSRNHARIIQQRDTQGQIRYQIIDIGSSNGTFVNGQRLVTNQASWLTSGNIIKIGNQEWIFEGE